jgi:hypothetical protein
MTISRLASLPLKFAPASLLAALLLASSANAQSQPPSQASSQSADQKPSPSASPSQSSADPQMQTVEGDKPVSLAEAARKAKAQKSKTDSGRVMTEDDLHSLHGGGVSVVGDASSRSSSAPTYTTGAPSARDQEEQMWRSRARALMDQMAEVDRAIETKKAEIAKYGGVGFDPSSGLQQNIVVIEDRNSQLKQLENQRARLDQQMDALQEQGRKAGADSSWFR